MTELERCRRTLTMLEGHIEAHKSRSDIPYMMELIRDTLYPKPIMEEVEEVVGWVNVYQHESGEIVCGTVYRDKVQADIIASGRTDFLSCQPIKVTVQREKKMPVERSATLSLYDDGSYCLTQKDDSTSRVKVNMTGIFTFTEDPTT